ncbi:MAG: TonB-dependent receptor, partial [Pseudomonadota bacterium]
MRKRGHVNWRGVSLSSLSAAALMLGSAGATAQDDPDIPLSSNAAVEDEERVEDEIIVYGTKIGLDLQTTTDSVEVLTDQEFKDAVTFDLGEIVSRVPNVGTIGGNLNTIAIRGLNRNGVNGIGSAQAINIFVDGAPLSPQALGNGANTLWDVGQVEVLRGSQSTIQGRNSLAGAVVVRTKEPSWEWEGAARIRFADFETSQLSAAISGPIIQDQVAFRLSVDNQERGGLITDGNTGTDLGTSDALTLRGRVLLEPKALDDLSALFTVEYNDRSTVGSRTGVISNRGVLEGAPFDPGERISFPLRTNFSDIETVKLVGDVSYEFTDNVSLQLIGTYEDSELIFSSPNILENPFGDLGQDQDIDREVYSGEALLKFDFNKLTGLIGGYYFNNSDINAGIFTNPIADVVPFPIPLTPADSIAIVVQSLDSETENFAFFTSWRYELNDKWAFDLGLRYDDEQLEVVPLATEVEILPDTCETVLPGALVGSPQLFVPLACSVAAPFLAPPSNPRTSNNFGVFLPRGVVTYNINEDVSLFAGARRGYRAGGQLLSTSNMVGGFRFVDFDPEFLTSIEAGWRSQWMDDRLTFNGTVFYSQFDDQQVNLTDDEGFTFTTNAGETALYGLELSGDFRVTDDWRIYGSVGLLETDIDSFILVEDNPATAEDETVDLAGNELERSPNVSFTIG